MLSYLLFMVGGVAADSRDPNGIMRWTTSEWTVDLIVRDNVIVEAPEPCGWAWGKDARKLWRDITRDRAGQVRAGKPSATRLEWIPDREPIDLARTDHRTTRHVWKYSGGHPALDGHMRLGTTQEGRWWVECHRYRAEWLYRTEVLARREVERQLAIEPERWAEEHVRYDGRGAYLPDVIVPYVPLGDADD